MSERIAKLDEKIAQLRARKQAEEAKLRAEQRKLDAHRKVVLGAFLLHELKSENPAEWPEQWRSRLDQFLTRDRDRALFGLPPRQG